MLFTIKPPIYFAYSRYKGETFRHPHFCRVSPYIHLKQYFIHLLKKGRTEKVVFNDFQVCLYYLHSMNNFISARINTFHQRTTSIGRK